LGALAVVGAAAAASHSPAPAPPAPGPLDNIALNDITDITPVGGKVKVSATTGSILAGTTFKIESRLTSAPPGEAGSYTQIATGIAATAISGSGAYVIDELGPNTAYSIRVTATNGSVTKVLTTQKGFTTTAVDAIIVVNADEDGVKITTDYNGAYEMVYQITSFDPDGDPSGNIPLTISGGLQGTGANYILPNEDETYTIILKLNTVVVITQTGIMIPAASGPL
jgi:hypothetical protein